MSLAGSPPVVPTNTAEADKLKSAAASAQLGRVVDWTAMKTAGNVDFNAKPRTGEWVFATPEWEIEQNNLAFVHILEAEERLAEWQATHASVELKRALQAKQELEKLKKHQTKTIPVSTELATGDAFFAKNKDKKFSDEMLEHDKKTDKRVRMTPAQQASAYACML